MSRANQWEEMWKTTKLKILKEQTSTNSACIYSTVIGEGEAVRYGVSLMCDKGTSSYCYKPIKTL